MNKSRLIQRIDVGVWLRPLGNAAYVACLPLLYLSPRPLPDFPQLRDKIWEWPGDEATAPLPGSKWLNDKELLNSIQKVLGSNPRWIPDFLSVDLFLTLSANITIHDPLIEYSEIVLR